MTLPLRLAVLLLALAGISHASNHNPAQFLRALETAPSITLMSIEPFGKPWWFQRKIQGHRILKQITIADPTKLRTLRKNLIHGIRTGRGTGAKCGFVPHHAIRFDGPESYEWLICYTCGGVVIYKNDISHVQKNIGGSPEVLDSLLQIRTSRR